MVAARGPGDDAPLPATAVPREMRPLVATIASLLKRVRSALERERRFTDDAAHELRTPLTGIKTHLQVLDLSLRECRLSPVAATALADANESVQRMARTLEHLLMLARIDGVEQSPADGAADLQNAAERAAHEAEAACGAPGRIAVEVVGSPPAVRCTEPLLCSALRNLLDNALRIAPAQTPVVLRVEESADKVRFTVLDHGPRLTEAQCAMAPPALLARQ